ncbi:Conserved_hypothetical protein [Hexamita inflata]|uniref:Uncharacterized protein n=1 Tax=Hexamita inflata TaxID=28002 RepID=A0ABP1J9E9_9EUKA
MILILFKHVMNSITEYQNFIQIGECYQKDIQLTIDKNLFEFTLKLIPNYQTQCNRFNGDIQINLTLFNQLFNDNISVKINNYNYQSTNQITFEIPNSINLNNYIDEHFILMQLFNLLYITKQQVQIFQEQRSDLAKCFESLILKFVGNQAIFSMCPNRNCIQLTKQQGNNQVTFVKEIIIEVEQFTFSIQANQLLQAYSKQVCYFEELQMDNNQLQSILQYSFIDSKFIIQLLQGKRLLHLYYPVSINTNSVSNVFKNQQAYLYEYGTDKGYQITFDYDLEAINTEMQTIENILYDKIEYKLTGSLQSNRGLVKQFITKSADNFNVSLRIVKFSCNEMRGAQQSVCNQMLYDDIHSENAVPTYNFDVMIFFQNKLIYLLKASNCLSRYTCWRYGVAILKDTELTLEMERNNICDKWDQYYDYSKVTPFNGLQQQILNDLIH